MYHHVGGEGRKHTPVVCNESREPHTSHFSSIEKKTNNNLLIPAIIRGTGITSKE